MSTETIVRPSRRHVKQSKRAVRLTPKPVAEQYDEHVVALVRECLGTQHPPEYLVSVVVWARTRKFQVGLMLRDAAPVGSEYAGLMSATAIMRQSARGDEYRFDELLRAAADDSDRLAAVGNLLALVPSVGGILDARAGSLAFDTQATNRVWNGAVVDATEVLLAAKRRYQGVL